MAYELWCMADFNNSTSIKKLRWMEYTRGGSKRDVGEWIRADWFSEGGYSCL